MMLYPALLLPAILAGWLYWRFVKRRNAWRDGAVLCLLLLFGYPMLPRQTSAVDIVVVADRSASIAPARRLEQDKIIQLLQRNLVPGDRMAIVSFNEKAHLEKLIEPGEDFARFETPYGENASDLDEGLKFALDIADPTRNARLLVLSDGEYTGVDPSPRGRRAAEAGVPISYRLLDTPAAFDLAARDAQSPSKVVAGEPFRLAFEVYASESSVGLYRVLRNGKPIPLPGADEKGWRTHQFEAGYNLVPAASLASNPGTYKYEIEVASDRQPPETILENNKAETYVHVVGEDRILVVNQTGERDNVVDLLVESGAPVGVVAASDYRYDLNFLRGYKGLVLENAPILSFPHERIMDIRRFVEQEGGGLLVTGGDKSFAAGGYHSSPLEDILPVSMELKEQTKKTSIAISIVLDRSGSMSMPVPGGQSKIDLANHASVAALDVMGPGDSISVIAVDSLSHVIVPQSDLAGASIDAVKSQILRIESMGGGIFVYTGLVTAGEQLANAHQANKHIILFSDANDSEEPGDYRRLLQEYLDAGITCSVVGLGTDRDVDAQLLKDIALRGQGNIYFTEDAHQLPQLFSFDTMTRTRRTFQTEPTAWSITPLADALASKRNWVDFESADYNLLFPRPEADTAIISEDADTAPGLAFWQRGSGRVAALAFDANGSFAAQPFFNELIVDSVRWTLGSDVRDAFYLRSRRVGNRAIVSLEVSEEQRRKFKAAELRVFAPGSGEERPLPMRWVSHDRLEVEFPLDEAGAFRGMLKINDEEIRMDPVALPGSPEFLRDFAPGYGKGVLKDLAESSGGVEALNVKALFDREKKTLARRPFVYPLLAAFLVLFLLDLAEQRFAMLPAAARWGRSVAARWRAGELLRRGGAKPERAGRAGASAGAIEPERAGVSVALSRQERKARAKASKAAARAEKQLGGAAEPKAPPTKAAEAEARPESGLGVLKSAKDAAKKRIGK